MPVFRPSDSQPILPLPHELRGCGEILLRGSGQIAVTLCGEGHVRMAVDAQDHLSFEGQGLVRYPASGVALLSGARGLLTLSGNRLDLQFRGGHVQIVLLGRFDVLAVGAGVLASPRGSTQPWPRHPAPWRIEGAGVRGAA